MSPKQIPPIVATYLPSDTLPGVVLLQYLDIYRQSATWLGYKTWCMANHRAPVTHQQFCNILAMRGQTRIK